MDGHVHEDELLAWILKLPLKSDSVDNGIEIGPVVGVGLRIFVVQTDGKSVVNKSLVERKVFVKEGGCVSVCRWQHIDLQS